MIGEGPHGKTRQILLRTYSLTPADLGRFLAAALFAGGDYADLYFEHTTASSILVDESLIKSASEGISMGCGVRVVAGEQTGYTYSDDLARRLPAFAESARRQRPVDRNGMGAHA